MNSTANKRFDTDKLIEEIPKEILKYYNIGIRSGG